MIKFWIYDKEVLNWETFGYFMDLISICVGLREPEHYGSRTLTEINQEVVGLANQVGMNAECRQTNHEGDLLDWIQALTSEDFLILNPGALDAYELCHSRCHTCSKGSNGRGSSFKHSCERSLSS